MNTKLFIVLNRRGHVRTTKNMPALARDEIAVGLTLDVPNSAFLSPIVEASLTVPDQAIIVPEITVETVEPPQYDTQIEEPQG